MVFMAVDYRGEIAQLLVEIICCSVHFSFWLASDQSGQKLDTTSDKLTVESRPAVTMKVVFHSFISISCCDFRKIKERVCRQL